MEYAVRIFYLNSPGSPDVRIHDRAESASQTAATVVFVSDTART